MVWICIGIFTQFYLVFLGTSGSWFMKCCLKLEKESGAPPGPAHSADQGGANETKVRDPTPSWRADYRLHLCPIGQPSSSVLSFQGDWPRATVDKQCKSITTTRKATQCICLTHFSGCKLSLWKTQNHSDMHVKSASSSFQFITCCLRLPAFCKKSFSEF